jgi:hypothetical protein
MIRVHCKKLAIFPSPAGMSLNNNNNNNNLFSIRYSNTLSYTIHKVLLYNIHALRKLGTVGYTYQTLPGREYLCKLFPAWESLVSDIPAGDGKRADVFLQCKFVRIVLTREDQIMQKTIVTCRKLIFWTEYLDDMYVEHSITEK